MRILFTAMVMAAVCASNAAAQATFVGVDDDPVLGEAGAPVTIIEFGDYQCPSCRLFWRDVEPRLKKEYIDTGKVKLAYPVFKKVIDEELKK